MTLAPRRKCADGLCAKVVETLPAFARQEVRPRAAGTMPCDIQPWPGALVSVRTSSGTVEGSTDVRGTVRLETRGPIQSIFVNGTPVADQR